MAVDLDPPPTSVVASVRRKAAGVEAEADWGDVSPEELVDVAAPCERSAGTTVRSTIPAPTGPARSER